MNSNEKNKPILITGSHRSGTTWIGRMLALSPELGYIHEPFNIFGSKGVCQANFENWFTYLCDDNGNTYLPELRNTLMIFDLLSN